MKRACLLALTAVIANAQTGMRDRYFTRYPFEKWLEDGERAQLRWSAMVDPPRLTAHQRLSARIEIGVDAKEIQKRRGRGEIVTLVQIEDSAGRRWRTHNTFRLTAIPAGAKAHSLTYTQELFILPGDYKFSMATCDSATGEYSFTPRALHVNALRGDPLPAAWGDLQPVEFVQPFGTPDFWFQPYVRGRLHLPLPTRLPVHVDLVMNMTPSERASGSLWTFRRNMSVLVPALKLLAGMELSQGTLDVALLDLTRRKIWEQRNARGLDWNRMRAPFADSNPGIIDVQSLAAKAQMTQFFWDRVLERLKPDPESPDPASDALRVVIVLSAPVFLEHQYKVEPASVPKDAGRRVFYLRYRPAPAPRPPFEVFSQATRPPAAAMPNDDLEHTLKSLDARVYNAISPEEFRRALSNVMAEVGKM